MLSCPENQAPLAQHCKVAPRSSRESTLEALYQRFAASFPDLTWTSALTWSPQPAAARKKPAPFWLCFHLLSLAHGAAHQYICYKPGLEIFLRRDQRQDNDPKRNGALYSWCAQFVTYVGSVKHKTSNCVWNIILTRRSSGRIKKFWGESSS